MIGGLRDEFLAADIDTDRGAAARGRFLVPSNDLAFPGGGGVYVVTRDNLGPTAGLAAAASLLIDYTLTVAVASPPACRRYVGVPIAARRQDLAESRVTRFLRLEPARRQGVTRLFGVPCMRSSPSCSRDRDRRSARDDRRR